ncbi:MAG: sulfite exporter TauE/SafE family protein [Pseudomonadota bacterium]
MASPFETYSLYEIAVIATALSTAALVKGVTGLGFSTVAVTLLAATIGLRDGIPIVIIPSLASNMIVMSSAGHFREIIWRFRMLYIAAPLGILAGLTILLTVDEEIAASVLGVTLISYCVFALLNPRFRITPRTERRLAAPVGFSTGLINGVTGAQIMPVTPYLLSVPLQPNQVVQALNCSFTISSLTFFAGLVYAGAVRLETILIALPGIAITFAGVKLGEQIRAGISPGYFRRVVLILMIGLGAILSLRVII